MDAHTPSSVPSILEQRLMCIILDVFAHSLLISHAKPSRISKHVSKNLVVLCVQIFHSEGHININIDLASTKNSIINNSVEFMSSSLHSVSQLFL